MALTHPDAEEVTVVLLGSFNPGIFHPEWFRRQEILLPAEAENAKIKVITPDITEIVFLDMVLNVLPNRLILGTSDISRSEKLQDVMLNVLRRLPHTPVTACGINNEIHFDIGDKDYWHDIGHALAPKVLVWNEVLSEPGMQSLTIKGQRSGEYPGVINVTVQPSARSRYGLLISANSHYDTPPDQTNCSRSESAVKYLVHNWTSALEISRVVAARIFKAIPKPVK